MTTETIEATDQSNPASQGESVRRPRSKTAAAAEHAKAYASEHPVAVVIHVPPAVPKSRALAHVQPNPPLPANEPSAATDHCLSDTPVAPVRRPRSKARAKSLAMPVLDMPAPDPTGPEAMTSTTPISILPPAPAINEEGGGTMARLLPASRENLPSLILSVREWQAQRVATMKSRHRLDNQCRSLARRALGWRMDLPEKERAAINKAAERLVKAIQDGGSAPPGTEEVAERIWGFCVRFNTARETLDKWQADIERDMRRAAEQLPAFKWWDSIRGVGALGLAIVVGEAGDLAGYANPAKLWKRFGLAPKGCYAMECKDGSTANAVPRRRRSSMFTVGDSLLKGNDGVYREIYDKRKADFLARGKTKMHAHRHGQRVMEKQLLVDLWKAWRQP